MDGKAVEPFDLTKLPLLRVIVIRLEQRRYLFSLIMHHIMNDGWGLGVLGAELIELYKAAAENRETRLPDLRIQYKDYAAWHNEQLRDSYISESHEAYWSSKLSGELPVIDLQDFPHPPEQTRSGANHSFKLGKELTERLKRVSQQNQVTYYTTLVSIVYVLLHRYTGQEDIVIGSPVSGRNHIDVEDQVGYFVNLLPLRTELKGDQSLKGLLANVKETMLEADEHQTYPFDKLVSDLRLRRELSRAALFDVAVVLHNYVTPQITGPGIYSVSEYVNRNPMSKWDLTFSFLEHDGDIHLNLRYNPDLFRRSKIERMEAHFRRLVEALTKAPDLPFKEVDLLTPDERRTICCRVKNCLKDETSTPSCSASH